MLNNTFDPALYYDKLPKKFKGKVEHVMAVSTSLEGSVYCDNWGLFEFDDINNGACERYVWRYVRPRVEKKILETIQGDDGDLVLLEQPDINIKEMPRPHHGDPTKKHNDFKYSLRINGSLFKTKSSKVSFLRS